MVPSICSRGVRQLSQAPHSSRASPSLVLVRLAEILEELDRRHRLLSQNSTSLARCLRATDLFLLIGDAVDRGDAASRNRMSCIGARIRSEGHPGRRARFLVVTLDVLGQIMMDDEAHIRLVHAHAERDRSRR